MKTKFIEVLTAELAKSGLSQRQFATKCGLQSGTMNRYLSGEREPSAQMVLKIAINLNVSTDYLLTGLDFAPNYKELVDSMDTEDPTEYLLI